MPLESAQTDAFCTSGNSPTDAFCASGNSPTLKLVHLGTATNGPTILVLGGISATPDLTWWPGIIGPDGPLDPTHAHLLSVPWLQTAGVTTAEQAAAIQAALDRAGIHHLDAVIGASYGGMIALALGARIPSRIGQLIVLAATHRPHPLATAWRWVQRRIAGLDPQVGLVLARALAMTTYRSDQELDARFADDPEALIAWLEHHGDAFTHRFTAPAFIALSAAIDRHRVDPAAVDVPTTLIGFDTDLLAPPWLLKELLHALPDAHHIEVPSIYGHDAFLKETAAVARLLIQRLAPLFDTAALGVCA